VSTDSRPSFLYAMDLGDGTFLVEETVLASRQPPTIEPLVGRLYARLAARGAHVLDVVAQEIVRIPLGAPVPPNQRVVATGAAGGLIHPATGYSLAASLRAAPAIASATVAALDRRATADAVSAAAWAALWPVARRRVRALEAFGLSSMLRMGQGELAQFFDAFFELPIARRSSYLAGGSSLREMSATMRALYATSPPSVRRHLRAGDVRELSGLLRR
jgi:lycopene beta-cyclase